MTIARFRSCALAFYATSFVAGCSGTQTVPMYPGTFSTVARHEARAWIVPQAKTGDLLYLSNLATNDVDVFSYPHLRLVGKLTGFGAPRGECVDRRGDVWIADVQGFDVIEYPHGATKPIAALSTPGAPRGCSVDPRYGDLAVTGGLRGIILAVYPRDAHGRWLNPKEYTDSSIRKVAFCGYDPQGNLFIDGVDKTGAFRLAELSLHATALTDLAVNQSIVGPGQVQWDGSSLAIGDTGVTPSVIYQFSVSGSTATLVGSTTLNQTKSVPQFWIDGSRVIGPDLDAAVGVWNYPGGGAPIKRIGVVRGYGSAISPAAGSRSKG